MDTTRDASSHRGTVLAAVLVAIAAAAAYASTRNAWFLGDDFGLIHVLHGKPLRHFFSLFTGSWTDNIYGVRPDELRPFVALAYQVDARGGAAAPLPYHLGSIAYHVWCSLLVFALARRAAGASRAASFAAGLFFAWHPVHSEAVAWISGRADSIPAFFYLSALLAYVSWRRHPRPWTYAASLALFVCALFSKQSAITLPLVLLGFDLLVERRGRLALAAVAPFAALTAGYLALRQVLFGNYVREQLWTFGLLRTFLRRQSAYMDALLSPAVVATDEVTARGLILLALALAATLGLVWAARRSDARALLFFGPFWYVATVGPLFVTYFSPRHLYLPSAGLAVGLAVILDASARREGRVPRIAAVAACAALLGAHLVALQAHNRHWNEAARASRALATEAWRVAEAAPPGSLVLIDVPWRTRYAFVWGWAVPFTMQPPFAPEDLTRRVHVVSHYWSYCCPQDAWLRDLRQQVDAWAAQPQPVIVVGVSPPDPTTWTAADAAGLRDAARELSRAGTPDEAERALQRVFDRARRAGRQ